jgi:hypothetical protein
MADNAQEQPPQAEQPKTKNQIKNEEKKKEKLAKLAAKQAKVKQSSQSGTLFDSPNVISKFFQS